MSIIMSCPEPPRRTARSSQPEPSIRELLDHIAVELAHEYVRLMETAADAGTENASAYPEKSQ
jgi:hypothetical protein